MKKYAKIIALILTVFTLCTILCSCDAIDEMQEVHGVLQDDGNIICNGKLYVKLSHYTDLVPNPQGYYDKVYITSKDIPLLFSQRLGDRYDITEDRAVICGKGKIYVVEEKYNELEKEVERASNGDYDNYIVTLNGDYFEREFLPTLTKEEIKAMRNVVSQNVLTEYSGHNMINRFPLYGYMNSGYFGSNYGDITYEKNGRYMVIEEYNMTKVFLVPEEYQKIFEELHYRCVPH